MKNRNYRLRRLHGFFGNGFQDLFNGGFTPDNTENTDSIDTDRTGNCTPEPPVETK